MTATQTSLDLAGRPSTGDILGRIRNESRDQAEKGRWFEQLFMRLALQQPEFKIDQIWRWPDWPEREGRIRNLSDKRSPLLERAYSQGHG